MAVSSPIPSLEKLGKNAEDSRDDGTIFTAQDLITYHEDNAGRLVVDPQEAKIEFGEEIASQLKLSSDGSTILWPQPTDDPEDPHNWSARRKMFQLLLVTIATFVPDFDGATGIAALFPLAAQFNITTGKINDVSSNWSVFLIGWGSFLAVLLVRRYGRLPVLFWSQLLGLGFVIGCAFAPTFPIFAAMRCLNGFFSAVPQVTGLYAVIDMYPFHLQARMLNLWTSGFILSPYISPFVFGFLVARTTWGGFLRSLSTVALILRHRWRWAYGIGAVFSALVVVLIVLFGEETMYDRTIRPVPKPATTGWRYRIETLVGITGARMAKYRPSWHECIMSPLRCLWRPHLLPILLFQGAVFGFSIGVNLTNAVFVGAPKPIGYGFSQFGIAGIYGTPIVAVILGEIFGRYLNDALATFQVRRNHGVFEAEFRLWTCYIAVIFCVIGFVVLGAAFQDKLSVAAIVMGWGIAEVGVMMNSVAVYAYAANCFPSHQGEISALLNLFRTLEGFAVTYFQVPWANNHGALQTFGCEAAIIVGLFLISVPLVQYKGRYLRSKYSF